MATSDAAEEVLAHNRFDLVVSDIARAGGATTGLDFLPRLVELGLDGRVLFYIGRVERSLGAPLGAFGITARPDELFHLVMDVLERHRI